MDKYKFGQVVFCRIVSLIETGAYRVVVESELTPAVLHSSMILREGQLVKATCTLLTDNSEFLLLTDAKSSIFESYRLNPTGSFHRAYDVLKSKSFKYFFADAVQVLAQKQSSFFEDSTTASQFLSDLASAKSFGSIYIIDSEGSGLYFLLKGKVAYFGSVTDDEPNFWKRYGDGNHIRSLTWYELPARFEEAVGKIYSSKKHEFSQLITNSELPKHLDALLDLSKSSDCAICVHIVTMSTFDSFVVFLERGNFQGTLCIKQDLFIDSKDDFAGLIQTEEAIFVTYQ